MLKTGLVSVTFRQLSPPEIVTLTAKAQLCGIEWGGDIHVPHGNIAKAREVSDITEAAGLKVAAYGSYYQVGCEEVDNMPFEKVLDTALALKAPTIRIWAGNRSSHEADQAWRSRVVEETLRISGLAKSTGISISFEYHSNTLTDTSESALSLMKALGGSNVSCYWQSPLGLEFGKQIESLKQILTWLGNIHVFWWNNRERIPLKEGINTWKKFIDIIRTAEGTRYCMLEFVKDDSPEQFLKDAEALRDIVKRHSSADEGHPC